MKMHTLIAGSILATALFGTAAFAQNTVSVSAPTSSPTPNEVVYVPTLPSVADLTKAATAQGITVEQINQTSSQITAVYKYANGQVSTVAYQPLSAAEASAIPMPTTPAPAVGTVAPATTVVYQTAGPGYYYDYPYPYGYYGYGWYPPVSIGLGFGFHGGGGFRGGFGGRFR
jgi:hypothetical protein